MNALGRLRPALAVATLFVVSAIRSFGQSNPPPSPQLSLFDALQSTLASQPQLHIQQEQVAGSRAERQIARGQFDTTLGASFFQNRINNPLTIVNQEQAALLGIVTNNQVTNVSNLDVSATKEFRNGVTISPSFIVTRATDNLYNMTGTNLSTLVFQVDVPLLRGRGRSAADAQETAAEIEVQASLLDLNQTISALLSDTASNYWNAIGAAKALAVAQESEDRSKIYVDNVQMLIKADRVPRAEIEQVNANMASRAATRIAAEQSLIAAQQRLALAMGLSTGQMANIETPTDDFPQDEQQALAVVNTQSIQQFFNLALASRADYLAARKRELEQKTLRAAARNGTRPQLNLDLSSGYSSLQEGTGVSDFFTAPGRAVRGPDVGAGVVYRFPPSNNAALGALRLAESNVRQAELRTLGASQTIMAAVVTAIAGVRNAALQLQRAREAVAASQSALDGEREKYRLGVGQIVDVLTIEDRLTVAEESLVNAELGYALALTQLRFATGTIVAPDQTVQSVDREVFLTVPIPSATKQPAGKD